MFYFITDCAEKYVSHYENECQQLSSGINLDVKDLTTRFTSDVIASTAFSLEVDSLKHKENYFYKQAALLSEQNLLLVLKFAGFRVFPKLMKILGIPLFPPSSVNYLKNLVIETMTRRENTGEYRPDMIHLLNQAKKGKLKYENCTEDLNKEFATCDEPLLEKITSNIQWNEDDFIAQAIVFILAGYGTTSTLLSFLMYELALNPEIQEKLRNEIDEILVQTDEKVSYANIIQMKYMDMVVSEGLRKWPPIPFINRLCVKDYDLGSINNITSKTFRIKMNQSVWIPVHSIHMNDKYWPNPTKFDPERFSENNKQNIHPQTYLPFGSGPRNCIGARFALMETKILLFYFLSKFELLVCEKTPIPMSLNPKTLFLESKEGYWLNLKLRNNKV